MDRPRIYPGSDVTVSAVERLAQQFVRSRTEPKSRVVDTPELLEMDRPDLEINHPDRRLGSVNRRVAIVDNLTGVIFK